MREKAAIMWSIQTVVRVGAGSPDCSAGIRRVTFPARQPEDRPEDRPMSQAKRRPFTLEELQAYLVEIFPQVWSRGDYSIEEVGPMSAAVRLAYHPDHLRPGGTISGPAMFALTDLALYVAILHEIGRVELAVTTNVSINFLRRPEPSDLVARARLIKLGKRLAVGEVALHSPGEAGMVAHAVGTYSIPARGDGR
jgi:uncharacterized protein (TIGR00369 family)